SIFSNVVYQRPYISTGTAAHVAGGLEIRVVPHLTIGGGAFAVRPFGNQTVYSRVAAQDAPAQNMVSPALARVSAGQAATETGKGRGDKAVFRSIRQAEVTAADLRDHGADAWASITLARGVSLNFVVARSVPFQLTTVHAGLTLDVAR